MPSSRVIAVGSVAGLLLASGLGVGMAATSAHHKPVTKYAVKAPASVKKAARFSVTITAETHSGARARWYRGTVKFSSSDHGATLPKKYKFTARNAGRHTFGGLKLQHVGNDTVRVTDTKHHKLTHKVTIQVKAVTPPPPACPTYTVDAVNGSDSNSGGCKAPFKTITHALSVATSGQTIGVRPGTYDAANGEAAELEVPGGVTLEGEGSTAREIDAESIEMGHAGSVIKGFTIHATVYFDSTGQKLLNSTVSNVPNCVALRTGAVGELVSDTIENCTTSGGGGAGLDLIQGSSATITKSLITASNFNIDLTDTSTVDLSGGGDTVTCGTGYDVYTNSTADVDLTNTKWDHSPPEKQQGGKVTAGFDIFEGVASGGATVTGYSLAANPCP